MIFGWHSGLTLYGINLYTLTSDAVTRPKSRISEGTPWDNTRCNNPRMANYEHLHVPQNQRSAFDGPRAYPHTPVIIVMKGVVLTCRRITLRRSMTEDQVVNQSLI